MSRSLRRGFSLIECIVSILMVSIMLILLQAVIQNGVLARSAKNQGIALAIARNELETLRNIGYDNLPPSGSFADSLLDMLPAATTTRAVSDYNAKTKQVTVHVIWKDPGLAASSTVFLSTLITKIGGLP